RRIPSFPTRRSSDLPAFAGEPAGQRAPLRRVARQPGIRAVLAVTVLLLTGHQAMYTYVAPFAPGRTGLVLLVFGVATVAAIWIRSEEHTSELQSPYD